MKKISPWAFFRSVNSCLSRSFSLGTTHAMKNEKKKKKKKKGLYFFGSSLIFCLPSSFLHCYSKWNKNERKREEEEEEHDNGEKITLHHSTASNRSRALSRSRLCMLYAAFFSFVRSFFSLLFVVKLSTRNSVLCINVKTHSRICIPSLSLSLYIGYRFFECFGFLDLIQPPKRWSRFSRSTAWA